MLNLFSRKAAPERAEPHIGALIEGETVESSDRVRMAEIFDMPMTASGAPVTETSSMRVAAVYACVTRIAGAIAQLPIHVYERVDSESLRVEHPYWWLLNEQPCPVWSRAAYWEFIVAQMLLRGDGIAYIARNRAGQVTGLIPWPRGRVQVEVVNGATPREPKRLKYFFQDDEGNFGADQDDVLHVPGFGFNGKHGMSVIQWGARNGIGIAIRGDEFAGKFYSQGAQPQFAVKTPGKMGPDLQDQFRDAWVKKYSGNGPNGIPLILTEGLDVKELTMSAVDAQLLESRQWQVLDIARAFGVPGPLVGEMDKSSSWGSSIEQLVLGFSKFTIGPHLTRIKDELNRKLFRTYRYYCVHNRDAMLEPDAKTQSEFIAKALGGPGTQGYMAVNEARRNKGLPPIPDPKFDRPAIAGSKPAPADTKETTDETDSEAAATGA
ncbi:phage portal protein [Pigmentiphaga sp. YJ18]|uniref:phage portal protein n=1 Tax=Pigmentiphaga sp. YJ18 TaxID=3134907 RepID=UPI0031168DFD